MLRDLDFSQRVAGKPLNILEGKKIQGERNLFLGFNFFNLFC